MRQASLALTNYLRSNDNVVMIDLYTFSTLQDGVVRFVDYPLASVSVPQDLFPGSPLNYAPTGAGLVFPRGPRATRSKISTKIGIEPQQLKISLYAGADYLIAGQTWQAYTFLGNLDGARVELDRLFVPIGADGFVGPLDTSLGAIVWFYGQVAECEVQDTVVDITVKSLLNLLQQQQMPRRLFQSGCTHVFGDTMCGYNRVAGLNALGTPTGIGAQALTLASWTPAILPTALAFTTSPAAFFTQGTVIGLSGALAGHRRTISAVASTTAYLTKGFTATPAPGDQFQLLPGCDHTTSGANGCSTRQNLLRFGGFPYIPPPELAL